MLTQNVNKLCSSYLYHRSRSQNELSHGVNGYGKHRRERQKPAKSNRPRGKAVVDVLHRFVLYQIEDKDGLRVNKKNY